eukprot:7793486-Pyramimonas_sp.AAC.1
MALIRLRRYVRRAQQAASAKACASRGPVESSQCPWEGPMRQLAMACDLFQAEESTIEEMLA